MKKIWILVSLLVVGGCAFLGNVPKAIDDLFGPTPTPTFTAIPTITPTDIPVPTKTPIKVIKKKSNLMAPLAVGTPTFSCWTCPDGTRYVQDLYHSFGGTTTSQWSNPTTLTTSNTQCNYIMSTYIVTCSGGCSDTRTVVSRMDSCMANFFDDLSGHFVSIPTAPGNAVPPCTFTYQASCP